MPIHMLRQDAFGRLRRERERERVRVAAAADSSKRDALPSKLSPLIEVMFEYFEIVVGTKEVVRKYYVHHKCQTLNHKKGHALVLLAGTVGGGSAGAGWSR